MRFNASGHSTCGHGDCTRLPTELPFHTTFTEMVDLTYTCTWTCECVQVCTIRACACTRVHACCLHMCVFACVCLHPVLSTVHAEEPSEDPVPSDAPDAGTSSRSIFQSRPFPGKWRVRECARTL